MPLPEAEACQNGGMIPLLLTLLLAQTSDPVLVPAVVDLHNRVDPQDGRKVVPDTSVDLHGVRVHFASDENAAAFAKKPAWDKLGFKLDGKVLDLRNAKCPTSGKPALAKFASQLHGVRVRWCSAECTRKLAKEPARWFAKLGYTYHAPVIDLRNTSCPVTGDPCYPEAPIWIDKDGIRIRVCCDHCVAEVEENAERVFKRMTVDPDRLRKKFLR